MPVMRQLREKTLPSTGTSCQDVPSDEAQISSFVLLPWSLANPVATRWSPTAATCVMSVEAGVGGTLAASHVSPSEENQALPGEPTATYPGPPAATPRYASPGSVDRTRS